MEITAELLESIQERAEAVGNAKFGSYPDKVVLDGGVIHLIYENYCCGSYETETEYVYPQELTEEIEEIERKAKIEAARKQEQEKLRRARIEQEEKDRKEQQEKQQYLLLKKKYG